MYSRIYVHILEIAYSPTLLLKGALTPSKWHISPNCWQNISNTNTQIQLTYIPPIVSRMYLIQIYIIQGPNLPGPNLLGPNLPPRGPICRGPICRGPICRQGAQSAGAQFAKKWQIGPQKVRGPICRQIGEGPNLPGPNLPGPNLPRTTSKTPTALCAESEVGILSTLYCSVCYTEQYIMTQYKLVSTCQ